MSDQPLPLFAYQPSARIVVFPMKSRVGKIRRTAEVLGERQGKGAEHYWRQVVTGVVSQMEKAGVSRAVIESEIQDFSEAVQIELMNQCDRRRYPDGDDAA